MKRSHVYQTKGRQKILEVLKEESNQNLSATEIYHKLLIRGQQVNLSTIYRYLDHLISEGIVIKTVNDQGERSGYRLVEEERHCHEHLHLQCIRCNKVIHLDCEFMNEIANHIESHHAFTLQCDQSVLYGICDSCKKQMEKETK